MLRNRYPYKYSGVSAEKVRKVISVSVRPTTYEQNLQVVRDVMTMSDYLGRYPPSNVFRRNKFRLVLPLISPGSNL